MSQTQTGDDHPSSPKTRRRLSLKRYRFFQCGFFILLIALAYLLFSNYNYLIFKTLVAGNYIYLDDLEELYGAALGENRAEGPWASFDYAVIAAFTEKIRSVNQDRYTYLYTPQQYTISREIERDEAKTAYYKPLSGDTVLLYLPNISDGVKDFVMRNRAELKTYKNLILDLRSNPGGLLADFYSIAELFARKGDVLGYEKTRVRFLSHAVKSSKNTYFNFDNILILQNSDTASAAEGLILSLKSSAANVRTVGEKTFGKGIGQVTIPLKDGYAVKATVLLVCGPDGASINRMGIEPDTPYEGDDILDYALGLVE